MSRPTSVELIASGYDWYCENCGELNHVIETVDEVTCKECCMTYAVTDCVHATP